MFPPDKVDVNVDQTNVRKCPVTVKTTDTRNTKLIFRQANVDDSKLEVHMISSGIANRNNAIKLTQTNSNNSPIQLQLEKAEDNSIDLTQTVAKNSRIAIYFPETSLSMRTNKVIKEGVYETSYLD